MNYPTSDLGLASYLCFKGYKIVEIKQLSGNIFQFCIDCPIEDAKKFQEEFIESDFRLYYQSIQEVKYIMRSFRDRQNIDRGHFL